MLKIKHPCLLNILIAGFLPGTSFATEQAASALLFLCLLLCHRFLLPAGQFFQHLVAFGEYTGIAVCIANHQDCVLGKHVGLAFRIGKILELHAVRIDIQHCSDDVAAIDTGDYVLGFSGEDDRKGK